MILDRERIESSHGAAVAPRADESGAASLVSEHERRERLRQVPFCVWITGAGSAALAYATERALFDAGLVGHVVQGGGRAAENADCCGDAGLFALVVAGTAEGWEVARSTVGADRTVEVSTDGPDGSAERIVGLLRTRSWVR
jgi:adenylylsulfate kinase-like enzyme